MSSAGAARLRPGIERSYGQVVELPSQLAEALDFVASTFQSAGYRLHSVVLPYELQLVLDSAPERWPHVSAVGEILLSFGLEYDFGCVPWRQQVDAARKLRRLGYGGGAQDDYISHPMRYLDGV